MKQKEDYSLIADEADRLNEEKQKLLVIEASKEDTKRSVEQMKKFINEQNIEYRNRMSSLLENTG